MARGYKKNRRKSYITIILVLVVILILAIICISLFTKNENLNFRQEDYYSNLLEEDFMQYEYTKINDELNGLCAFGMIDDSIVGIDSLGNSVNIIKVSPDKTYDYSYYSQKLYLLEKESGTISIIPLKTEDDEYKVDEVINLGVYVDQIQIYEKELYYLSEGVLYKYINNNSEAVFENISSDNFVIKQAYLYVIVENKLKKISLDTKEEKLISDNVVSISYFNYYEKNKLIFETCFDGVNNFKNIYHYYNEKIENSIKNNGFFIPYDSNQYIYINNENTKLFLIDKNGNNKLLYTASTLIQNTVFIKDGHILLEEKENVICIDVNDKKEESNSMDFIDNIKYIK